jgi:phosphate transport system substrate-binding protein
VPRFTFAIWLAFGVLVAGVARGVPATAETIRVGGTGAGTVAMHALAEAIETGSGVAVRTLPSLGSAGGMRALNDGRLDLAVIGREMADAEAKAGARIAFVLRTPFVFVTSEPVVPRMRAADLVAAYADPKARWPSGRPVALVLRQRSDGDARLLDTVLDGMAAAVEGARRRPEVLVSTVDDDNADMAERTAGSLATMSYSQVMTEARKVRMVTIDGVAPSLESFSDGRYPHGRSFFLVAPAKPGEAALRVLAFLRSAAGAEALRAVHCLPGDVR